MTSFIAFAIYLCVSVTFLVVCPVMMHPTLPRRRKLLISSMGFTVLVPIGLLLYAWLGVPRMGAM
jgi:hypothetical protein